MHSLNRLAAALVVALLPICATQAQTTRMTLLSHAYQSPLQALSVSDPPAISGDGNFVAFSTRSTGFVSPAITFAYAAQVYVYDIQCGRAELVSSTWNGAPANGPSGGSSSSDTGKVSVSRDGRYVAFTSNATNLAANDSRQGQAYSDVFLVDRDLPIGDPARVRRIGTDRIGDSTLNGTTDSAEISADGRYVVFESDARNLLANDPDSTNIFRYTIATGEIELVSKTRENKFADGSYPTVSADGNRVFFRSGAYKMVHTPDPVSAYSHVYVRDISAGTNELIDRNNANQGSAGGAASKLAISDDGRYTSFIAWTPDMWPGSVYGTQTYLRDSGLPGLFRINHGSAVVRTADLDQDGGNIVFVSEADYGVYRQSPPSPVSTLVSRDTLGAVAWADKPAISGDGQRIVFLSSSGKLVPGVTGASPALYLSDSRPTGSSPTCSP